MKAVPSSAINGSIRIQMDKKYIEDQHFDKVDFTAKGFETAEYDNCRFTNCNFSNADLSNATFAECEFQGCNLSMAKLSKTSFRDAKFIQCKLLGLHFQDCDSFLIAFSFEHCQLNIASFYKLNLKKTRFSHCVLQEADFTEADCQLAVFDHCDLANAIFDNTNLEKADLRSALNYSIDPSKNKIKKAKFSLPGVVGLMDHLDIIIE